MFTHSRSECSCKCAVKNGPIMVGWVGECCCELGTPIAIP